MRQEQPLADNQNLDIDTSLWRVDAGRGVPP